MVVDAFSGQFTKELLEFLELSNSVYILKLKNGWYIGSFIETTLRVRLSRHYCFKNDTFMSIYCVINVSPDSYIDAAVIERCMQNYAACVLKISKKSIYSCGVQGFTATEEQIKEVIMSTLSQLYLPSYVKFDNNTSGLIQFNEFYLAQGWGFWKKLVINKVVDTYKQTEGKRYYNENKEKEKERCKRYYNENKEKEKEKNKRYYDENKEKEKERSKRYYDKNKEKIKSVRIARRLINKKEEEK